MTQYEYAKEKKSKMLYKDEDFSQQIRKKCSDFLKKQYA